MKTHEITAGHLDQGDVYREFGDDWKTVVKIGWHGDAVLIWYVNDDTPKDAIDPYETTLDQDLVVEVQASVQ